VHAVDVTSTEPFDGSTLCERKTQRTFIEQDCPANKTSFGRRLSQPIRWRSTMAGAFATASSFVSAKTWSGCVRKSRGPAAAAKRGSVAESAR
jgi:hypothetical protein